MIGEVSVLGGGLRSTREEADTWVGLDEHAGTQRGVLHAVDCGKLHQTLDITCGSAILRRHLHTVATPRVCMNE